MKTWYRVSSEGEIRQREVVRVTAQQVVFVTGYGEQRENKNSSSSAWFEDARDAAEFALELATKQETVFLRRAATATANREAAEKLLAGEGVA